MTSYIIRRLAADHPDGLLRALVPLLPLLHAPGRPGDADRRRRQPGPRPDPASSRSTSATASTTRSIVQFVNYWKRTCSTGTSASRSRPAAASTTSSASRRRNSLRLAFWAILIEIVVGISRRAALGDPTILVSATSSRRSSPRRRRRSRCSCSGFLLQYVFAVVPEQARTGRSGRSCGRRASAPTPGRFFFIPTGEQWRYLILPAITLACVSTALAARMTRGSMLEVMRADYMRTARAKGLR